MTPRFYAYLDQDSGCDYTIACGKKLVPIHAATTRDEAIAWVFNEYGAQIDSRDEMELSKIHLLDVAAIEALDLGAFAQAKRKAIAIAAQADKEAADRAEFERLKAKFEGR